VPCSLLTVTSCQFGKQPHHNHLASINRAQFLSFCQKLPALCSSRIFIYIKISSPGEPRDGRYDECQRSRACQCIKYLPIMTAQLSAKRLMGDGLAVVCSSARSFTLKAESRPKLVDICLFLSLFPQRRIDFSAIWATTPTKTPTTFE
jgi:hypothetical protein